MGTVDLFDFVSHLRCVRYSQIFEAHMRLTKLQTWLKTKGVAARRFKPLSAEARSKIADPEAYDIYQSELFYSPWKSDPAFTDVFRQVSRATILDAPRCWILYCLIKQALPLHGELWECGVYKGGTALMLRMLRDAESPGRTLRLFDSFEGMPETDAVRDVHKAGDFADTSLEAVRALVGTQAVDYHAGFIPQTFVDLEVDRIAFAHVDLDLYEAIHESCRFIYPRLAKGAVMIFDDYGFPSCPGARIAVDNFFGDKPEFPLVLPTGQAVVHKL